MHLRSSFEEGPMDEIGDKTIEVELRADLAIYVTSSLYAIIETMEDRLDSGSDYVTRSRLAAIEVLCDQISRSLSEELDREDIDEIIGKYKNRK